MSSNTSHTQFIMWAKNMENLGIRTFLKEVECWSNLRKATCIAERFSGYLSIYRLFVCQDENENEPEDESFCSFWIKPVTNEPGLKYNDTLKGQFVRHA